MRFDGKSAPISRAVSDRVWNQVRPLLDLPEDARDEFEGIVGTHLMRIEHRNRAKSSPNFETLCDEHTAMFTPDWIGMAFALQRDLYKGRTPVERAFVRDLVEFVERFKGKPPNHGKKWLPKLVKVCALIDPEITSGVIEGASRGRRNRLSR
jgi:hypothetical protein